MTAIFTGLRVQTRYRVFLAKTIAKILNECHLQLFLEGKRHLHGQPEANLLDRPKREQSCLDARELRVQKSTDLLAELPELFRTNFL